MSTLKTVNIQHPSASNTNIVLSSDGSVSGGFPMGGRNKIINGGFDVWQRGTSFSSGGYTADRWLLQVNGSGATRTVSQQEFSPGNAIPGYEPTYFLRYNQSVAGTSATYNLIDHRIEDVRTFAGQTVTVSFWAKAAATTAISYQINQIFGSGGSPEAEAAAAQSISLTTSWQRFSYTATLASISGKTIGTGSYVFLRFNFPNNATFTVDLWGVQIEAGSVATPFETKPYAQELRDCQRYYARLDTDSTSPYGNFGTGAPYSSTRGFFHVSFPSSMRAVPTLSSWSNLQIMNFGTTTYAVTDLVISANRVSRVAALLDPTSSGLTAGQFCFLASNNSSSGHIAFTAEL